MKFFAILIFFSTVTFANCPNLELKETMQDCPYAQWSRDLELKEPLFWEDFQKTAKTIAQAVDSDSQIASLKKLWGKSFNYDENAKAIILSNKLYGALAKNFGVPVFSEIETPSGKRPYAHAGLMHTYGYLFSNLVTPYGYKRARWVSGDIEVGFGLKESSLTAIPKKGTLLTNLTYFIGSDIFQKSAASLKLLETLKPSVSDEVLKWDWSKIEKTSITETPNDSNIETLHTEFYRFPNSKTPTDQSHLLVYWVENTKDATGNLITAFPVKADFVASAIKPENFGANVDIKTRYNALVEKITLATPAIKGSRSCKTSTSLK